MREHRRHAAEPAQLPASAPGQPGGKQMGAEAATGRLRWSQKAVHRPEPGTAGRDSLPSTIDCPLPLAPDGAKEKNRRHPPPLPPSHLPSPAGLSDATARLRRLAPSRRLAERVRELPCWLTSLVLHLLLIVVLGSLVIQPVSRGRLATLVLSFEEGEAQLPPATPVVLEWNDLADEALASEPLAAMITPAEQQADDPPIDLMEPPPQQQDPKELAPSDLAADSGADAALPAGHENPSAQRVPAPPASNLAARVAPPDNPLQRFEEERRHDRVVDRFIQYDIGKLPGPEGALAKSEFDALGRGAIPALVRGLNKAAQISASCPYLVIAHKLDRMLAESDDPAMLDYALENLGRGVPESAPYANRLRALRARLEALARGEPSELGAPPPQERVWTLDSALSVLTGDEQGDRRAAAQAVLERLSEVAEEDKQPVALALIGRLHDADPATRRVAREALVRLTGEDLGSKAHDWYGRWDPRRYSAMADSLFGMAERLEAKQGLRGARRFYQKVIDRYPASEAAAKARSRVQE